MPEDLRRALLERAEREGTTVSDLARQLLTLAVLRPMRPEVRVQIELHRALLGKLLANLGTLRDLAHRNIDRMRGQVRGPQAQGWLDEWERLIEGPPMRLVDVFLGEDEHSIDLRQVSPFAGALSEDERRAAIRRARAHA